MALRTRPTKHITIAADLLQRIEEDAARLRVSASEVIESHLTSYYAGGHIQEQLARLEQGMQELRAQVLPLVARVNVLLQQVEHQAVQPSVMQAPVKVATYAEMYGEDKR
jgi:hypothetical protein